MVEIFGKYYYVNLDAITDACKVTNVVKTEDNDTLEINIFKYEILKMCIERVLNEFNDSDDEIEQFTQRYTSPSFRLAFNTLVKNNILIEDLENE